MDISLTEEQRTQMGPKAAERYELISAKIESFPKAKHSEWYFAELMKDPDVKKALEGQEGMPGGKSLGDALADGDVKIDENGNLVDKDGNPVTVVPGNGSDGAGMDDHGGWDQLSDEERELVKGQIKQAMEAAVRECDNKGQWGSVGASMRATLREMISKEIPLKSRWNTLKNVAFERVWSFVTLHDRNQGRSTPLGVSKYILKDF